MNYFAHFSGNIKDSKLAGISAVIFLIYLLPQMRVEGFKDLSEGAANDKLFKRGHTHSFYYYSSVDKQ